MRVAYAPAARRDLNDILLYTEREWGVLQRRRYRSQVRDMVRRLATMPAMGTPRDDYLPGLRSHPVGSHVIYYVPQDQLLLVLHVLHRHQDPDAVDWKRASEEPGEHI